MAKIKRNPATKKIAMEMLKEYQPESVGDMHSALKEIFGPSVVTHNPFDFKDSIFHEPYVSYRHETYAENYDAH